MAGYGYPYPPAYPPIHPEGEYPDHGDGFGDYYGLGPEDPSKRSPYPPESWLPQFPHGNYECGDPWGPIMFPYTYWKWMSMPLATPPPEYDLHQRPSCSKYHTRKSRQRSRSRESDTKSHSKSSKSHSRSRSRSKSRSISKSRSHSKSRSRSASRSHSRSTRHIELTYKQPTLLDAFRVIYLTPSKHKKSTTKYLATKKKQDRIQEILKSDGLGSKRWLFYPRTHSQSEPPTGEVPGTRDNVDQRIKVDGDFFRKYKKNKKVESDAPITKLKRWELVLYKKLGFVQAV